MRDFIVPRQNEGNMMGESSLIAPIGVHHVDFKVYVPIPTRREGNPFTVRVTMRDYQS